MMPIKITNNIPTKTAQQKTQKTPRIRFGGFSGNWEEKKLGEVCEIKTGNKDTQDRVDNGKYPFYVRSNTVERINSFSFDGEAILTSGDGVGVGKNFHYIVGKFDYHQRVYSLNSFKEGYSGKFIYNVFSTRFYRRVSGLSAKNSVDSVRMDMIADMRMYFPSLPEQQKIAEFLGAVDGWVENLRAQKASLESYKKGIMQKIFSQEIRFKSASGKNFLDWEEKKLGEVATFLKGKGISKDDVVESGKNKCIRYGELYTKYDEVIESVTSYTNAKKEDSILSSENDVLMPTSDVTPNGLATASALNEGGIILGGDILIVRSQKLLNTFFSYYVRAHKKDVMRLVSGVTVYHLYGSDLKKMTVSFPSLPEQQKIAGFLTSLDKVIESKQHQITQAEEWKKGLMQGLFV